MTFHGMIEQDLERILGPQTPLKKVNQGKILLGVLIYFVVLIATTLMMNWVGNPDIFKPVFSGLATPNNRYLSL